MITHACVFNI